MTALELLQLGAECWLRELTDKEYEDLVRRVRPSQLPNN